MNIDKSIPLSLYVMLKLVSFHKFTLRNSPNHQTGQCNKPCSGEILGFDSSRLTFLKGQSLQLGRHLFAGIDGYSSNIANALKKMAEIPFGLGLAKWQVGRFSSNSWPTVFKGRNCDAPVKSIYNTNKFDKILDNSIAYEIFAKVLIKLSIKKQRFLSDKGKKLCAANFF